jgi:hypothetical protein
MRDRTGLGAEQAMQTWIESARRDRDVRMDQAMQKA